MELGRLFGQMHPMLVHLPLVLLLVSFGLELIGFFSRDRRFPWAAQVTLLLGTVATLFAFVCGNFAEIWAARDGIPQDPMEFHELLATITSWTFVFLAAGRFLMGQNPRRRVLALYLSLAAIACVLLIFTGHKGAMLVYQHGAGVQTGGIAPAPTHEDLAVLRQQQDPDALFYSNQMHHIFGWMVLILSGLLLVDTISPKAGERLRKVGPLLLLAGGIFLMIYSDTDSWPLSAQRPITDKEVLMHKTYAILMLIVGLRGLWRRKGSAAPTRQVQARMMAVFALVGGALLFTHVHSNAPYANVAVGVYLHHTAMGLLALTIGAVKLIEDALSTRAKERATDPDSQATPATPVSPTLRRFLAWAYPCLMLGEAIFLLNYNEGLPWFLGYRNLSLKAPHQGLIAPLGSDRAEMVYDPAKTRFDLYVLDQSSDTPLPKEETAQMLVKVGTETTVVALTPDAAPGHYTGTASFLRNQPLFQTQALLTGPKASRLADFEPWTDPTQITGHKSQAAYICPMHPALGAGSPGRCSVCGMALVPNRPDRPWNQLHDDAYKMDLALQEKVAAEDSGKQVRFKVHGLDYPAGDSVSLRIRDKNPNKELKHRKSEESVSSSTTRPGRPVPLVLTPRRADGSIVAALETVHTKKLHLIVVRSDLSYFDHVHPVPQPDGTLTLDYAFPKPGEYLLYADLTPMADRNQVFRLPVTVEGTPALDQHLTVTPALAKVFGNYRVALQLSPETPKSGDETQLSFTISENGIPVGDLEPYLGAGGHCVILSEDTLGYLHSHPTTASAAHYGPTVTFHTLFPRPGLYKIWGQFQHHGKILTADFVIRVQ